MARNTPKRPQQEYGQRAAIYARVSDKSQDTEDKTSISEQIGEMEAYCESKGLTITARYQEVGRGWSKKRPEFQRMLADAKQGRFDTIVCWKSDRLSRGMYPAAALMEVVEAHQIRLEAVMDSIDMKTFGLMAAIGKIELDNFRERASMGKRGAAKQGRIPTSQVPYGYYTGDDGKPRIDEARAEVVRCIFRQYVHEGMGAPSIARQLMAEGVPTGRSATYWHDTQINRILRNETYKGHLVVWQGPLHFHRGRNQGVPAIQGHLDRGPIPATDGRGDLGTDAGPPEAAVEPFQAQYQDLPPVAAHGQVHRVRDAHGLPDHQTPEREVPGPGLQV